MRLSDLLPFVGPHQLHGRSDPSIVALTRDSREARPGVLFFAIRGGRVDGHLLVASVTSEVVVVEHLVAGRPDLTQVVVPDTRAALARVAAGFFGEPSHRVSVVGVTGTNGKTTTSVLGSSALRRAGGRIGTLGAAWADRSEDSGLTTPEAHDLQRILAAMADDGVQAAFVEVSSVALVQRRAEGVRFHTAVFTNLTQDHLDFHGTMQAYAEAKALLFREAALRPAGGPPRAILCGEDSSWNLMSPPSDRWLFGFEPDHDVRVVGVRRSGFGQIVQVKPPGAPAVEVRTGLLGRYNALNIAGTLAALLTLGLDGADAADRLSRAGVVPGRMEPVMVEGKPLVLVDYAHTPDALENLLNTVRATVEGRVILVFGCGGDRDKGKRPIMGEIAARLADEVFVTSDNPRGEDPARISAEVIAGARRPVHTVLDRAQAIAEAIHRAGPSDVVVVAGKGHEVYQEICGQKHPFDDRAVARAALEEP